jgi:hypothetical protein
MDSQNRFGNFASTATRTISELPGRMVAETKAEKNSPQRLLWEERSGMG